MPGYTGRILKVDLTTKELSELRLNEDVYRDYIGGSGLAARLFFDCFPSEVDPLAPQNPLIFTTGPLTGTGLPGCATRFSVASRSPLTRIWGESSCGGDFGWKLKSAGYDGILVLGKAEEAQYLYISDGRVELRPATTLWGKDTYQIVDELRREVGNESSVLAIGQAGENLVSYACLINDKRNAAGRTGLGAVMGSKKLKAIVVQAEGKPEFAHPQGLDELQETLWDRLKKSRLAQGLKLFGTDIGMVGGGRSGDVPIKNWQKGSWDEGCHNLDGRKMAETILTGAEACYGCPIECKRVVRIDKGPFQLEEGPGPEYETVASFGTMLLIDNLEAVAKAGELCNRYGIDTISCGATIAFAMECFEHKLISIPDTDGMDLSWGNAEAVIKLVQRIGKREGFGDLLAKGSRAASQQIGKNSSDFLVEVKGLELPMHDPRAYHGMGLAYAVSNRGACHVNSLNMSLFDDYQRKSSQGKAYLNVKSQDLGSIFNSACICIIAGTSFTEEEILKALNYSTGFGYALNELMTAGERIWLLKRGINNLFGVTKANDRLPKHILTPTSEGGAAGSIPDIDMMLEEFYQLRGLDEQGRPQREKLEKLGLADLAEQIQRHKEAQRKKGVTNG